MRQSLTNLFASSQISKLLMRTVVAMFLLTISSTYASAQAKLSIQGIIKRSNGSALEDGVYPIKFNIYAKDNTPPGILWTETIEDVDVNGGIYSEILGDVTALTVPFDQDYTLGIEIGGKEMNPRIDLTSAPYALSIRGQSNVFPSAGLVLADDLRVAQGVLAGAGAPGLSGENKNGYGMIGNNDTGVFSTAYGKVSLFVTNVEKLEVTTSAINLNNPTTVKGNVNLENNGGITYTNSNNQSFNGWRLVDVDDFSSGTDGWFAYSPIPNTEYNGWNSTTTTAFCPCGADGQFSSSAFVGSFIFAGNREDVFKKQYTIPGSFSQIMVKFRYIAMDTWDDNDYGFAGFASSASGDNLKIAWYENLRNPATYSPPFLDRQTFREKTQIRNFNNQNSPDMWKDVEISARANGNNFWLMIGSALQGTNDEGYGIGYVEVWVR